MGPLWRNPLAPKLQVVQPRKIAARCDQADLCLATLLDTSRPTNTHKVPDAFLEVALFWVEEHSSGFAAMPILKAVGPNNSNQAAMINAQQSTFERSNLEGWLAHKMASCAGISTVGRGPNDFTHVIQTSLVIC